MKKIINSNEAYEILDESKASGCTFQSGGCAILADALSTLYDVPLYIIFNETLNRVEHFCVKINSKFMDSDGMQSKNKMLQKIREELLMSGLSETNLELIPYNDSMNIGDIPRDKECSKRLVELFNK